MRLDELEIRILNAVVDAFMNLQKSTGRKDLVVRFKSYKSIDRLVSLGALKTVGPEGSLAPSVLGLEYAGAPESLRQARASLEIVLHVLKNLYEVTPSRKQVTVNEVQFHAADMYADISTEVIYLGLHFVRELAVLDSYGSLPNMSTVQVLHDMQWMMISERIVEVDAGNAWDEHIRRQEAILDTHTPGLKRNAAGDLEPVKESEVLILISHSSKDADLAAGVIDLLRSAMRIPREQIVCSSVDGYRLPLGARTDEELRRVVAGARLLVGLLTPNSLSSTYVLFELGARWGADLPMMPLWAGLDAKEVEGPMKGVNAASCSNPRQLIQFVEEVGARLELKVESASSYLAKAESVRQLSDATPHPAQPAPLAHQEDMAFDGIVYWRESRGAKEGPYCARCYEAEDRLLHLKPLAQKGSFMCRSCGQMYQTRDFVPPVPRNRLEGI